MSHLLKSRVCTQISWNSFAWRICLLSLIYLFIYLLIQSFLYMSRSLRYSFHTLNSSLIVLFILLLKLSQFWPLAIDSKWPLAIWPLTPVSLWCNPMVLCVLFLFVFLTLSYSLARCFRLIFYISCSRISDFSNKSCSFIGEQYSNPGQVCVCMCIHIYLLALSIEDLEAMTLP